MRLIIIIFLILWPVILCGVFLGALVGGYYHMWRYLWRGK